MRLRRRLRPVAIYAACIAVLLVFLAPLVWVLQISFKTRAQIFVWPPTLLGFTPTLDNYRGLLSAGSAFPQALANSLVAALAATGLALMVALPAAYALADGRVRGAGLVRWGILLFRMMPPVALLLPYYLMARQAGLLGSLGGVAIAHFAFCLAVTTWMMRDAFAAIPLEIAQAAEIDGCTRWQVFSRIALPLARASIAASAIFALITSWNEFLFAVALSRPATQTIPVAVSAFVGDVYVSWGQLAAATVIGVLPALALAFLGQRWLLTGMAPGAFK